jgi:hypothetical protein
MGQAKQRGTLEQRRAQSLEREHVREQRYNEALAARQEAERKASDARHRGIKEAPPRPRLHRAGLNVAVAAALLGTLYASGSNDGR